MTEPQADLAALGVAILRARRRLVGAAALAALGVGLVTVLLPREYAASATFIPQRADPASGGIALAATQFGLRLPGVDGGWGPALYVELLRSPAVLAQIARDSVRTDSGGARRSVMELLEVPEVDAAERVELTVRALRNEVVVASDDKVLGSAQVTVTTRWPQASYEIAVSLLDQVNRFNVESRNAQAASERRFAEEQAREAEERLREAEDRLQDYLESNRALASSPSLQVRRDRLQREVTLRQQVLASLVQSREDARLREVRDVPGITVLEAPEVPALPVSRQLAAKMLFGAFLGFLLGVLVLIAGQARDRAYASSSGRLRECARLLDDLLPAGLRDSRHSGDRDGPIS